MKLKQRNLQRLASLSAVGAGAVFVTADKAEASAITYSGPLNISLGWPNPGHTGSYTQTFGGQGFRFKAFSTGTGLASGFQSVRSIYVSRIGNLNFGNGPQGAGATWGSSLGQSFLPVIDRAWGTRNGNSFHHIYGFGAFSDRYLLFRFNPGAGPLYGWMELTASAADASGADPTLGPSLTIQGWAYDTTGAKIHAGDTGSATPEPGTFALTGLAALALGAACQRRVPAARVA